MNDILSRVNQHLLFFVLIVVTLYFGKPVLVPLMLGALLAMLMAPVCQSLDDKGLHRAVSTVICILILALAIAAIFSVIIAQINSFMEDLAMIKIKTKSLLWEVQSFIEQKFNIPKKEQETIAKEQVQGDDSSEAGLAGSILTSFTATMGTMILMLVYTFLFLYNKEKYETFFVRIFHTEDPEKVKTIVGKIAMVGQKYLTGRAMSVIILTTLYSIALFLIGLDNAVILGGIAALLTIIPYVGTTIGGLFPFIVALTTEPTIHPALMVAGAIILIQTIDNYFIEPNVVGGEVNLSAFASIISIIIGGIIWGVAGMILFLPIMGILKIIFDHVESLKPLGYIIGDSGDRDRKNLFLRIKERFQKKESEVS
jgi:predicted PurR-regulated permease PerM